MMADGRFSSFRKEAKGYVHFLGARKRNQKNIHPYPSSPYMERLKLRTAETDSSECVLVSRDDAMGCSCLFLKMQKLLDFLLVFCSLNRIFEPCIRSKLGCISEKLK